MREAKTIEKKLKRFRHSLRRRASVVFCVQCGSTSVDATDLTQLACRACGNSIAWDGLSFNLAAVRSPKRRCEVVVADAEAAFTLRETTPPWVGAGQALAVRNRSSADQE